MVKVELVKRDFVWIGLLIVLVGIGFVYGFNSGLDASIMGHSGEELMLDGDTAVSHDFCVQITGHACGVDIDTSVIDICGDNRYLRGDGECVRGDDIVTSVPTAGADCARVRLTWGSACSAYTEASSDNSVITISDGSLPTCGTATVQCRDGSWVFVSSSCGQCSYN